MHVCSKHARISHQSCLSRKPILTRPPNLPDTPNLPGTPTAADPLQFTRPQVTADFGGTTG
ncbi:MAG: hypothetical protein DVB26_01265 [Verrucomicrobia bacterium]|nr:MAG: hypothetical protein DVB26_01265 [Verrucomicrobiota bacterium]